MFRLSLTAFVVLAVAVFAVAASADKVVLSSKRLSSRSPGSKLWSFATGGNRRIYSDPAVTDFNVFIGSADSNIYSLNRATGATNWSYSTGDRVYGSPVVCPSSTCGQAMLFIGGNSGMFYALAADKGTVAWTFNVSSPVLTRPALYGNLSSGLVVFGGFDGIIYALDMRSGSLVWNYTTTSFVTADPQFGTTSLGTDVVVIGAQDYSVVCLETLTGTVVWTYQTEEAVQFGCSVSTSADNVVCGAKKGKTYGISLTWGTKLWERAFGASVTGTPVRAAGDASTVFFPADFNVMYAVDAATGSTKWKNTGTSAYLQAGAAVLGGYVYFGTSSPNTTLICLDAATGAEHWTYVSSTSTAGGVTTAPYASTRDIFFGTANGDVIAVSNV